jgi:hypothetical protein
MVFHPVLMLANDSYSTKPCSPTWQGTGSLSRRGYHPGFVFQVLTRVS